MKKWITGLLLVLGTSALAGSVGLPMETISLPVVDQDAPHLICVWDASAGSWAQSHIAYDNSGTFSIQITKWGALDAGQWYWIGLWDSTSQHFIFGRWIGHVKTN